MERFSGKVLLVTGGASGIGEATARRFASEGGRVSIIDIDAERGLEVASELPESVAFAVDVADDAALRHAVAATLETHGHIDCVVNGAGHVDTGPIAEWPVSGERWSRMIAVTLNGMFSVCREVAPVIRRQGGGAIVNVSSVAGLLAFRNSALYGTMKTSVIAMSRHLARELAPEIRVNVVCPGRVHTRTTEPTIARLGQGDLQAGLDRFSSLTLQKRAATADEIAAPICFLLSDEASYIVGASLVIDGGETIVGTSL
jgi:NAD(P)-dependent dehydrogenase (short-subunit alcohol dehydrogenase family)